MVDFLQIAWHQHKVPAHFAVAALSGLADANGSAMLAARQAAAAQLEQFRAEMVAEAAKMRAAVERQVWQACALEIHVIRLLKTASSVSMTCCRKPIAKLFC